MPPRTGVYGSRAGPTTVSAIYRQRLRSQKVNRYARWAGGNRSVTSPASQPPQLDKHQKRKLFKMLIKCKWMCAPRVHVAAETRVPTWPFTVAMATHLTRSNRHRKHTRNTAARQLRTLQSIFIQIRPSTSILILFKFFAIFFLNKKLMKYFFKNL